MLPVRSGSAAVDPFAGVFLRSAVFLRRLIFPDEKSPLLMVGSFRCRVSRDVGRDGLPQRKNTPVGNFFDRGVSLSGRRRYPR